MKNNGQNKTPGKVNSSAYIQFSVDFSYFQEFFAKGGNKILQKFGKNAQKVTTFLKYIRSVIFSYDSAYTKMTEL